MAQPANAADSERTPMVRFEEVSAVSAFIPLLLVLGGGLLVGSLVSGAREAHTRFTSYRHRTTTGFVTWLRQAAAAALSVAGLLVLLYVLLVLVPTR